MCIFFSLLPLILKHRIFFCFYFVFHFGASVFVRACLFVNRVNFSNTFQSEKSVFYVSVDFICYIWYAIRNWAHISMYVDIHRYGSCQYTFPIVLIFICFLFLPFSYYNLQSHFIILICMKVISFIDGVASLPLLSHFHY